MFAVIVSTLLAYTLVGHATYAAETRELSAQLLDLRNRSYLLNEDQIRPELDRIAALFNEHTPQAIRDDWVTQYCRVIPQDQGQSGLDYANKQLVNFQQRGNLAGVSELMRCQASYSGNEGQLTSAETAFNAAYSQAQELNDVRLQADSLLARGDFYAYTGELALALTDLLLSQRLFEALQLEHATIGNLTSLAHVYRRLGDHEKSREYYQSVIERVRILGNPVMEAEAHMFVGWGFIEGLDYAQAEKSFAASRELHAKTDPASPLHEYFELVDRLHLGVIRTLMGQHQQALIELQPVTSDKLDSRYAPIRGLALYFRAYAIKGIAPNQNALEALMQAEDVMSKLGNQRYLVRIYRMRSEVHTALGQHQKATQDLIRFIDEKEKLDQKMRSNQTARLRIEFDTERTTAENRRLQAEQKLQEQQVQALEETKRWQLAFMLLGSSVALFVLIRQLRRARRLYLLAMTDELTRLPNRRAIMLFGSEAWKETARASKPLSVIVFDIDHFKRVNDTWGHEQGDKVLQGVANAAQSCLREKDRVGRTGGEEFLVLMPGADTHHAQRAAERVRQAVETMLFSLHTETGEQQTVQVTVSLGVTSRREGDTELDKVIHRGDMALYRAKSSGRNRVETDTNDSAKPSTTADATSSADSGI